jgi:predicted phosphodiesterase
MKVSVNAAQRHIAYHDVHVPHNIDFGPVLAWQKKFNPTHIIINGDFLNLEHASHWNEGLFKTIGYADVGKALKEELIAGQALLKRIRAASPKAKIYFVPGNHEHWLYYCALYFPQLGILLGEEVNRKGYKDDLARAGDEALAELLRRYLQTDALGITVLPFNEPLEIGHIMYLHGHQLTIASTAKMYPMKNLVFGHWHEHSTKTLNDSGDPRFVVEHTAVPCMTHLGPKAHAYRQGKSSRWMNGFYVAEVDADGLFDGRIVKILGGKRIIQKP